MSRRELTPQTPPPPAFHANPSQASHPSQAPHNPPHTRAHAAVPRRKVSSMKTRRLRSRSLPCGHTLHPLHSHIPSELPTSHQRTPENAPESPVISCSPHLLSAPLLLLLLARCHGEQGLDGALASLGSQL